MASCTFFELDYFSRYADGIGIFGSKDESGRCVRYKKGTWAWEPELDAGVKAAKTFGVFANLALVSAFVATWRMIYSLNRCDRQDAWDWARTCHGIALCFVLITFSFAASDTVSNLCGDDGDGCSLGPAGAANVCNVFLLTCIIVVACYVPIPNAPFTRSDCCCPLVTDDGSQGDVEVPSSPRMERLMSHQKILYHQTNQQAAEAIKQSRKMKRGSSGLAGGGIYFTESIHQSHNKARQTGYMVVAKVKLGKPKRIAVSGDSSVTYQKLLAEGYDSVLIPRANGEEWVVYNWDQVEVLSVTQL